MCAQRRPRPPRLGSATGAFGFLLLIGIVICTVLAHVAMGGPHLTDGQVTFAFGGGFFVATAMTAWLYRPWEPVPPCTSFYQAVFVAASKRTFLGRIEHVVLGFANPDYAKRFQERNPQAELAAKEP